MSQRSLSQAAAIILAVLSYTMATIVNNQPQITLKAEKNKAFNGSCLFATFNTESGNIADCLEHCLKNCRCQSFQICQNTKCQLCSSHKEENSSLLHEKDSCVYATYEICHSTKKFQKLDDQCSDMSCSMKYNCCQQSDLCPKNKICKPFHSQEKSWKRFTCECPDGYHGDNCEVPITSCQGYAMQGSRKSGMYKIVDPDDNSVYEVYCHFDSDGAWTLVQSFSFANGSASTNCQEFRKPLSQSHPVGENDLVWSGYRLRKSRMQSIEDNSTLLRFTCDHIETRNVEESDHLQISLNALRDSVLPLEGRSSLLWIQRGKIGGRNLSVSGKCLFNLYQYHSMNLCAASNLFECGINPSSNSAHCNSRSYYYVFGNYDVANACFEKEHRCIISHESTTQLWFGH